MTQDLDILALQHVPAGWHEVISYQTPYCSLGENPAEFPGTVTMRAAEDADRTLWVVCSRWDAHGNRYDEPGYDADRPYIHPACDAAGDVRMIARYDKAASANGR